MVDVQTVSIVLAALSFILAATYYSFNMRHAKETRQAQLFMQLTTQLFSKEMIRDNMDLMETQWDNLEDFYTKYDSSVNKENFVKRFRSWYIYDQVGFLLKRGLIDKEMTFTLMGGMNASWSWQKFKSIIEHQRDYQNMPELAVWFEYLVNKMNKMNEKRGHPTKYREDPSIYPEDL